MVHVLLDHSGISGAVLGMVQILILGIGIRRSCSSLEFVLHVPQTILDTW